MSDRLKSWVWQYGKRVGNKAFCYLCDDNSNKMFCCAGGSTGAFGRHLKLIHNINGNSQNQSLPPSVNNGYEVEESNAVACASSFLNVINTACSSSSSSSSSEFHEPLSRKRRKSFINKNLENNRICCSERTEEIHNALAKMIAINQMPLSFCSSSGFKQFMSIVEPNYVICKERAIKQRLEGFKSSVEERIKNELKDAMSVSCTSDCWSSIDQESYITVTVHFIDNQWYPKSYTLTTRPLNDRQTVILANELDITFNKWEIDQKIIAVVADDMKNVLSAVDFLSNISYKNKFTCAAHNLQLAVKKGLKYDKIDRLIQLCSNIVRHFKNFKLASQQLKDKQEQLGLPTDSLIQSCDTQWNSIFLMLERLHKNRYPITNFLAEHPSTSAAMGYKFEVTEQQWTDVESLVKLLKPFQIVTSVFCGEKYCSISMVRPLLKVIIEKHLKHQTSDGEIAKSFKTTVIRELTECFNLQWCSSSIVSAREIASFLDPRYKDLEHETVGAREEIRTQVKNLMNKMAEINCDVQIKSSVTNNHDALEFLYGDEVNCNTADPTIQFQNYLAEPQLRFDFDPLEWWRTRTMKYSLMVDLAIQYLGIPAISDSSKRRFLTAGNIVTTNRSCLAPETMTMQVFLHQNKQLL